MRVRTVATALCTAVALTGCSTAQLGAVQFTKDNRLTFTSPAARSVEHLPFTISWTTKDFTPTGENGQTHSGEGVYALFLDLSPMAVGENIKSLFDGDLSCSRDPRCPDASTLADKGIYITSQTAVHLLTLPQVAAGVGDEQHDATVVLLDGKGFRRIESSWNLEFKYPRRG